MSSLEKFRNWNRERVNRRRAGGGVFDVAGRSVVPDGNKNEGICAIPLKPSDLYVTYDGLRGVSDDAQAHLGGNVVEGDPFTYAPLVWDYLIRRFAVQSVLDLGSGMGYSAAYFYNAGIKVIAAEGLEQNCESAVFPTILCDMTLAPVKCKVDLVHCQEVVEHIEEVYLDNLIKSLCCGKYVLMTNALPGQGGHHHVNEQPTEYWIEKMSQYGCEVLLEDSNRIRELAAQDGAIYLAKTGLVLANRNR